MKNFTFLIILFSLLFAEFSAFTQITVPAGYVSGHWNADKSPYQIEGNIELHQDSSLIIDAGVEVLFMQNYRFRVYGSLQALGHADSLIIFDKGNPFYSWKGLEFRDTTGMPTDSSVLEYCNLSSSTQDFGGAVGVWGYDSLRIEQSIFEYNAGFKGGAIYIEGANPILKNLILQDNISVDGGALFLLNASPVILNSIFRDNDSDWIAGGIFAKEYSSPLLENCLIENNTSVGSAGGIYFHDYCEPVLKNCTISNNYCQSPQVGSGGGMKINFYCHVRMENCLIINNVSNSRGGGMTITSDVDLVNCLISGNEANMSGGGIAVDLSISYYRPTVNVINSTITDNTCQVGAGINSERSDFTLINSIVYQNNSGAGNFIDIDKTAMFINYSNIEDSTQILVNDSCSLQFGPGNLDMDPMFFNNEDFRLSEDSPCINVGTPDTTGLAIPVVDLDGFDRVYDGRIDMGCYENQYYMGSQEKRKAELVKFYPNPVSSFLHIESSAKVDFIEVVDELGRMHMYYNDLEASNFSIDLNKLKKGIYFLRIKDVESNFFTKKILVE